MDRVLFLVVVRTVRDRRSGAGDSFLAFFGGGVTGDAGAGAGLVMVSDAVMVAVFL